MDDWCALAREGSAPPVTIPLQGSSMQPLIRRGTDPVTVVPLSRPLRTGDVVLFTTGPGRYVIHRVWKLRPGNVRTLGDNCWKPEPWLPISAVLGQVVCYTRNGRKHRLDTRGARLWGRVWMAVFPLRRCCMKVRSFAGRCYRKLFRKEPTGGAEND